MQLPCSIGDRFDPLHTLDEILRPLPSPVMSSVQTNAEQLDQVTAVVLNFRTPEKTIACLYSLLDNAVDRIVLVENSEDQGASLVAMRVELEELRSRGASIEVIDEGRNLGFSAGVNRALARILEKGGGDVLLLNSDARLATGAIPELVDAVRRGACIAAPMLTAGEGESRTPCLHYQRYLALLTDKTLWGSFAYLTGACMLLSRSIAKPGLFDEQFFFYGEDVMLGADMDRRGLVCMVAPGSRVVHEGTGSARNGSLFYEYHINRGHWLLAVKLAHGRIGLAAGLIGRAVVLPLRALVRSARLRNLNPARGLWMATCDTMRGRLRTLTPPSGKGP